MTRTDTIAHLDTLTGMLRDVINYDANVRTSAGDPSVSAEELKRYEACIADLKKLATKTYETSAVCYRVRDDRRNEGDYEQAEMTFEPYRISRPSWYQDPIIPEKPQPLPNKAEEPSLLEEAEPPSAKPEKKAKAKAKSKKGAK